MRAFDWDLIRAEHYGQRLHRRTKQAGHMTAPDQCCSNSESSCQGGANDMFATNFPFGHVRQADSYFATSSRAVSFAERLIGTIRRECVDHVVVLGETHLRRMLREYARYYNTVGTHRSLDQDAPISRPVQQIGRIVSHALVGGLHHQYVRI
jgi:Integrase core domain